jgi:endonuclease YncB( thermonuclease family)
MGGITTKMKRIIDIDKLQEAQQRQKKQKTNYWQRKKNDPCQVRPLQGVEKAIC